MTDDYDGESWLDEYEVGRLYRWAAAKGNGDITEFLGSAFGVGPGSYEPIGVFRFIEGPRGFPPRDEEGARRGRDVLALRRRGRPRGPDRHLRRRRPPGVAGPRGCRWECDGSARDVLVVVPLDRPLHLAGGRPPPTRCPSSKRALPSARPGPARGRRRRSGPPRC